MLYIIKLTVVTLGIVGIFILIIFSLPYLGITDCGTAYPVYGKEISIQLDTIKIEENIKIPDGELLFTNLGDTLPPIMIKINNKNKLEWAYRFDTKGDEISMNIISDLTLDLENKKITFFNKSHYEPGVFYFTNDYDFDYVCLSPF